MVKEKVVEMTKKKSIDLTDVLVYLFAFFEKGYEVPFGDELMHDAFFRACGPEALLEISTGDFTEKIEGSLGTLVLMEVLEEDYQNKIYRVNDNQYMLSYCQKFLPLAEDEMRLIAKKFALYL